jgi:FkbM family methyltransferase
MSLRPALERASHRVVVRRRLPPPFEGARIYVSTEGGLRYLARPMARVDPALLRLAAEVVRRGDTVWDIGANLGLFSFAAAVMAGPEGRVLAVEPDTDLVGLLRRSAARAAGPAGAAGLAPVEILPAAISDDVSVARFHIARRNRATSHLAGFGSAMAGGVRSTRLVPTVTLDWLAARFRAPDVVKIDVEGAELAVLAGGSRVLSDSPAVICEVSGHNAAAASSALAGHGYTLYDGDQAPGERVPVPSAPFNTLAIATPGSGRAKTSAPKPGSATETSRPVASGRKSR